MEKTIYLTITKSYTSSATEHTAKYRIEGVSNLVGFLNDSINGNDDIFTGLTYNDPGDETWTLIFGEVLNPNPAHTIEIKTWRDINLFIRGLLVSATYEWL